VDLVGIEPTTSSMPSGKTGPLGGICYQNATNFSISGKRVDRWGADPQNVSNRLGRVVAALARNSELLASEEDGRPLEKENPWSICH